MTDSKKNEQENSASNQLNFRRELFNIEAEQSVLGTIILNNEYLNRVSEFLLPEHFYEPVHQKIFSQIIHNVEKVNIVANQITLKQFFDNDESIKLIGGSKYLSALLIQAQMIIDIVDYAKIIYNYAIKRKLAMIGEEIVLSRVSLIEYEILRKSFFPALL